MHVTLIEQHRLNVSAIGSPILKYSLTETPAKSEKRDSFRSSFTDEDMESTREFLEGLLKILREVG
jgi:hypothetical protein